MNSKKKIIKYINWKIENYIARRALVETLDKGVLYKVITTAPWIKGKTTIVGYLVERNNESFRLRVLAASQNLSGASRYESYYPVKFANLESNEKLRYHTECKRINPEDLVLYLGLTYVDSVEVKKYLEEINKERR